MIIMIIDDHRFLSASPNVQTFKSLTTLISSV